MLFERLPETASLLFPPPPSQWDGGGQLSSWYKSVVLHWFTPAEHLASRHFRLYIKETATWCAAYKSLLWANVVVLTCTLLGQVTLWCPVLSPVAEMFLLLSLVGGWQKWPGLCLARPLSIAFYWRPSFHTSQSVWFSLHPFPLSLCSVSHEWVTGRWPTGVCFAFLQTTFVLPHQHFSHICLASLGVLLFCLFFQKKQSTYRQAQKKRRKHLGWADQFAYPQGKWSTWLMPQKAMGPGDHPNMWIMGLVVPSVWNWKGDQSKPSATTFSVRLQKEIHAACPEEHS